MVRVVVPSSSMYIDAGRVHGEGGAVFQSFKARVAWRSACLADRRATLGRPGCVQDIAFRSLDRDPPWTLFDHLGHGPSKTCSGSKRDPGSPGCAANRGGRGGRGARLRRGYLEVLADETSRLRRSTLWASLEDPPEGDPPILASHACKVRGWLEWIPHPVSRNKPGGRSDRQRRTKTAALPLPPCPQRERAREVPFAMPPSWVGVLLVGVLLAGVFRAWMGGWMDGRMGVWRLKGVRPGRLGHLDVWIAMGNQHSIPNGVSMTPRAEQSRTLEHAAPSPRTFLSAVAGRRLVLSCSCCWSGDMQVGGWVTNTILLLLLCGLYATSASSTFSSRSTPFLLSRSRRLFCLLGPHQMAHVSGGAGARAMASLLPCPSPGVLSPPPSSHLPGRACLRCGLAPDRRTDVHAQDVRKDTLGARLSLALGNPCQPSYLPTGAPNGKVQLGERGRS